jgi:hypothetical protein
MYQPIGLVSGSFAVIEAMSAWRSLVSSLMTEKQRKVTSCLMKESVGSN